MEGLNEILKKSMEYGEEKIKSGEFDGNMPKFVAECMYDLLPQKDFDKLIRKINSNVRFDMDFFHALEDAIRICFPNEDRFFGTMQALMITHLLKELLSKRLHSKQKKNEMKCKKCVNEKLCAYGDFLRWKFMTDNSFGSYRELLEKLSKPCDMSPEQIAEIRDIWGDHIIGWNDEFTVEFEETVNYWIAVFDEHEEINNGI